MLICKKIDIGCERKKLKHHVDTK